MKYLLRVLLINYYNFVKKKTFKLHTTICCICYTQSFSPKKKLSPKRKMKVKEVKHGFVFCTSDSANCYFVTERRKQNKIFCMERKKKNCIVGEKKCMRRK